MGEGGVSMQADRWRQAKQGSERDTLRKVEAELRALEGAEILPPVNHRDIRLKEAKEHFLRSEGAYQAGGMQGVSKLMAEWMMKTPGEKEKWRVLAIEHADEVRDGKQEKIRQCVRERLQIVRAGNWEVMKFADELKKRITKRYDEDAKVNSGWGNFGRTRNSYIDEFDTALKGKFRTGEEQTIEAIQLKTLKIPNLIARFIRALKLSEGSASDEKKKKKTIAEMKLYFNELWDDADAEAEWEEVEESARLFNCVVAYWGDDINKAGKSVPHLIVHSSIAPLHFVSFPLKKQITGTKIVKFRLQTANHQAADTPYSPEIFHSVNERDELMNKACVVCCANIAPTEIGVGVVLADVAYYELEEGTQTVTQKATTVTVRKGKTARKLKKPKAGEGEDKVKVEKRVKRVGETDLGHGSITN